MIVRNVFYIFQSQKNRNSSLITEENGAALHQSEANSNLHQLNVEAQKTEKHCSTL